MMWPMTSVGVRHLKDHLGSYLAKVRRGETVIITDRGVPVARIDPLADSPPPELVRELVGRGLMQYRRPGGPPLPPPVTPAPGEMSAVDFVIEQRR